MRLYIKKREFKDGNEYMIILMNNIRQVQTLLEILESVSRDRYSYNLFDKSTISAYMMELYLPYEDYLAMVKELSISNWLLKPDPNIRVDMVIRMVKFKYD